MAHLAGTPQCTTCFMQVLPRPAPAPGVPSPPTLAPPHHHQTRTLRKLYTHHTHNHHYHSAPQVLFQGGRFQWDRLENLLRLAKEGTGSGPGSGGGLDLSATVSDGARVGGPAE